MTDIEDVTEAADRLDARLHADVIADVWANGAPPLRRVESYTFAELISAADKEKLLEFGRHIV